MLICTGDNETFVLLSYYEVFSASLRKFINSYIKLYINIPFDIAFLLYVIQILKNI